MVIDAASFSPQRPHLLDLSMEEIEAHLATWGEPRFRARQVAQWALRRGATSFEEMSNLPASLRARLAETFEIGPLPVLAERIADDGATTKVLLGLPSPPGRDDAVEAVRMDYDADPAPPALSPHPSPPALNLHPSPPALNLHPRPLALNLSKGEHSNVPGLSTGARRTPERTTVCVSTQVGCAMACAFCATGQQGFTRNLRPSEILEQVLHFTRSRRVTNVVFMGMGEPLANYAATLRAIRWMVHPDGLGLRQRGITVSTVGLLSGIRRLAGEGLQVGLTVSLHAPDDDLRRRLIPTATGVTIDGLIEASREYIAKRGRRVTFAYALLEGVNDSPEQARALARRIPGIQAHVNLIPYNPTAGGEGIPGIPGGALRRPSLARVRAFQRELQSAGINATVRVERGQEIAAACGQLRTDIQRRATAPLPLVESR